MSTPVTYVGSSYNVPAYQDTGYAQGTGNLSSYLIALATGSLTLSGGSFPLTADANFGGSFGLVSLYYKSRGSNLATTGVLRLASAEMICWRNNANSDNLELTTNASDQLTYNGVAIASSGGALIGTTLTLTATSNQMVIGTTNTTTVSYTAPAASRVYTVPDAGGAADFVLTAGAQTIAGAKTFSDPITQNDTSNQLVLGVTNTTTISATAPAASRVYTIPDAGGAADFVLTAGAQSIAGVKTFTSNPIITLSGPSLAITDTGTTLSDIVFRTNSAAHISVIGANGASGNAIFTGGTAYAMVLGTATAHSLELFTSDAKRLAINSAGEVGLGPTATPLSTVALNVQQALSGSNIIFRLANATSGNASSGALGLFAVEATTSGDPYIRFSIGGGADWCIGADNSVTNDPLTISRSTALGTTDIMTFDSADVQPGGPGGSAAAFNFGDAANYWADIPYKTLTDRGCIPWCDDGVELTDGRRVSDLEAICATKMHPTRKTPTGLPRLDYTTFPKHSYKTVEDEVKKSKRFKGCGVERDASGDAWIVQEDGTKIPAQDGVEMTMMFGVILGAFKEIAAELKSLKSKVN